MANQAGSEIIRFKCGQCSADLIAPSAQVGEIIICNSCKSSVPVPADRSESAEDAGRPAYTPRVMSAPYAPRKAKPPAQNSSARGAIIGLAALIVLTAGGIIGYSMYRSGQRQKMQEQVASIIAKADAAVGDGNLEAIDKNAKEADVLLKTHGKDLDSALVKKWEERLAFFSNVRRSIVEVQEIFDAGEIAFQAAKTAKDSEDVLASLNLKLKARLSAEGPAKDGNKPVIAKLDNLLMKTGELQLRQKTKRLAEDLAGAEKFYQDEKIEEAASKAKAAAEEMGLAPKVSDAALLAQAKVLQERAAAFKAGQAIAQSAASVGYPAAIAKMQAEIDKLPESAAELKPLRARFLDLKKKLSEKEQAKLAELRKAAEDAQASYQSGKIEEAGAKAACLKAELALQPDKELEAKVSDLAKFAAEFKQAKAVRSSAAGNFAAAQEKLDKQLKDLGESNAAAAPLAEAIRQFKRELKEEEHPAAKLSKSDLTELGNIASFISRREPVIEMGTVENDSVGLTVDGKTGRLTLGRTALNRILIMKVGENRLQLNTEGLLGVNGKKAPHSARVVKHALELGGAMRKAGVRSDEIWDATGEAPFWSARSVDASGKVSLFLNDRLYTGKALQKSSTEVEAEADFLKKVDALALAVEKDEASSKEARDVIVVAIKAAGREADWFDHLKGEFVRKVIASDYIESNLPGTATRLKKDLDEYRAAYAKISTINPFFNGVSDKGDELVESRTFEEHSVWQIYDKAADTTTFAIKDPDDEKEGLFILYDFPGKLSAFPEGKEPGRVRMSYQPAGVIATYDPASGKMTHDPQFWDKAVAMEAQVMPEAYVKSKGFGPPAWSLPPHVLLVDRHGNTKGIVTPFGKLEMRDFSKIADKAKRAAEMEAFFNQIAKALPTGNYLHLYFRYFHEYIFDSPIPSCPNLLGSRSHCGDLHQTASESICRLMGGRYVGDCDDLAEFFMNITRRQNKLSFVMALPGHAACGWAEKAPDSSHNFYVADTGPPRQFNHKELDKAIEMANRAYDETNTMRFDAKALGYLFRFNGEATRTPYQLSSRMYVDKAYAEAMELVQSYWHFHFYALGIKTMTEMIEKGDRVPENCVELAGLYGQVCETENSIKWTMESLKQLGTEDRASRFSETVRIGTMWHREKNKQKAYESVQGIAAELKQLEKDANWIKFHSSRLELMGLLTVIDRPWEGWDVVSSDIGQFFQRQKLRFEHVGSLTGVYKKMKDLIADGKQPDAREKAEMDKLENILNWFYANAMFEPDDDFGAYLRKYASLGVFYAGKFGNQRFKEELLKAGPFPDPAKPRDHRNRKDPEAEDWKWIRMAIASYSIAIGEAIDFDEPPEKWKKDDAVKLIDLMPKAAAEAMKFGSITSAEFDMLGKRVLRAFLLKDWADLEKVLAETGKRDFARLTSEISETFGGCARLATPDEFAQQYKVFAKHIKSRPAYFTVIYEAFRGTGYDQAVAASKVALEAWPGDADMAREAKYLKELADKKKSKAAEVKK
jgi:hypothetical protein